MWSDVEGKMGSPRRTKARCVLICVLLAMTSCAEPDGFSQAKYRFAQHRGTYEKLLKAIEDCDFQMKKGKEQPWAMIPSDPGRSGDFWTCGGDMTRTSAIAVLLKKVGVKYVQGAPKFGDWDFFYSDEFTPGTKTRTRLAIAYRANGYRGSVDDDSAEPACVIRVRALMDDSPHHWLWVYRFTTADTNIADSEWCDDLRLP
jgi:hypothetical protein